MKKLLIMLTLMLSLTACSMIETDDNQATAVAVEWGEAFFNCDYHAAEALCTPESYRWLQLAASNTTQHDLDLLRQHAAEVAPTDYFPVANDTLRVVELEVRNSINPTMNSGESPQVEEALFHITVVKRDGRWQVRMADLPRNEKRSRD